MAERYFNPFQNVDVTVPVEYHDAFSRYTQRASDALIDQSPFPRMVDLWFLAVCVAARLRLPPMSTVRTETRKIIEGSIFASDPWRVHALMLIAITVLDDVQVVSEPRQMIALFNGLAVAGLPKVLDMLRDGESEPIWNLSDAIEGLVRGVTPATRRTGWPLDNDGATNGSES